MDRRDGYLVRALVWNRRAEKGGEPVRGLTAEECADRAGWWFGRYLSAEMEKQEKSDA